MPVDPSTMALQLRTLGLLQPVSDPLSARRSIEPGMTLEGGGAPYRGGAEGRPYIGDPQDPYAALPFGRKVPMDFKFKNVAPGVTQVNHPLPGELEANYYVTPRADSTVTANLEFGNKSGRFTTVPFGQTPAEGRDRLRNVFGSVEHFINTVKPGELTFSAYNPKLVRLYDRVAPQIADQYGGTLTKTEDGHYQIAFPNAAKYPTTPTSPGDL